MCWWISETQQWTPYQLGSVRWLRPAEKLSCRCSLVTFCRSELPRPPALRFSPTYRLSISAASSDIAPDFPSATCTSRRPYQSRKPSSWALLFASPLARSVTATASSLDWSPSALRLTLKLLPTLALEIPPQQPHRHIATVHCKGHARLSLWWKEGKSWTSSMTQRKEMVHQSPGIVWATFSCFLVYTQPPCSCRFHNS